MVLSVKYIALLALVKIVPSHPHLVAQHQDTILASVDHEDISIRLRALDLVSAMVTIPFRNSPLFPTQGLVGRPTQPPIHRPTAAIIPRPGRAAKPDIGCRRTPSNRCRRFWCQPSSHGALTSVPTSTHTTHPRHMFTEHIRKCYRLRVAPLCPRGFGVCRPC
jgi:hypothetical protein